MTVPIDFDVASFDTGIGNDLILDVCEQLFDAVRCDMATGITHTDSIGTQLDGSSVYLLDFLGFGASRVFCDKHHGNVIVHREGDGFLSSTENSFHGPILSVLANRTGAEEGACLNLHLMLGLQVNQGFDI